MTSPFDVVDGSFSVLVNAKGQHSLWPEAAARPAGWERVHGPADRETCLSYVAERWTGHAEHVPLSHNQRFLFTFDKGDTDGALGERHTLVSGWRLSGRVDPALLQGALDDVVARHEVLRTSLTRDAEGGHQEVHPASPANPVRLTVRDLSGVSTSDRARRAEELLNEIDAEPFPVRELPHLRAVLGRFGETDSTLVLASHHTATDGWSMGVILRDLAACYAARRSGRPVELPEAEQYRELAAWQQSTDAAATASKAIGYWRRKLSGARILAIPTDRPLTDGTPDRYAAHRFVIDAELSAAVRAYARSTRSSRFMVLLAAYHVQLRELTGVTDIVTPTFTFGRYQDRFAHIVGPFFNMLPLRTDLVGCRHFRDVLERTRATCGESYTRDIPFAEIAAVLTEEAPALTAAFGDRHGAVAAFEMLQDPSTEERIVLGDAVCAPIRDRRLSQPVSSGIPNGALWALDMLPSGEIAGSLKYNRNTFDDSTIAGIVSGFLQSLRDAIASPERPLTALRGDRNQVTVRDEGSRA